MKKKIAIGAVILLVVLQFFPSSRNLGSTVVSSDISNVKQVSPEVMNVLKEACYDCHSNTTRYPWYAGLQPIGWWINRHVIEGKQHLNFSDFGNYSPKKSDHKLQEVAEVVAEGEMPLSSYTLIHSKARLNSLQKRLIIDWANSARSSTNEKASEGQEGRD